MKIWVQVVYIGEWMCEHMGMTRDWWGVTCVCVCVCVRVRVHVCIPGMFGKGNSIAMQMGLGGHLIGLAFQLLINWPYLYIFILKVKVAQSCLTLCDPMDHTVDGILQARILEWVAIPFSRGSSQRRDQTQVSCIAGRFFTSWATRAAYIYTPLLIKLKHFGWTLTCNCKIFGGLWV